MSNIKYATITHYIEEANYYIKFFLLDDSLNLNAWKVSKEALARDLKTFIGTPFVVTRKFDHPTPDIQESERDGTIKEVGFDDNTGKAWAKAIITNEEAKRLIDSGEVNYVSPSISIHDFDMVKIGGQEIALAFTGQHVAGVKEPAFGKVKAQIKGKCYGSESKCNQQLNYVQASIDKPIIAHLMNNKHLIRNSSMDELVTLLAESPCMETCLSNKKDEGIPIDDQAIAICMNECGVTKESSGNQMVDLISQTQDNSSFKQNINQFKLMEPSISLANPLNPTSIVKKAEGHMPCPDGQKEEMGKCVEAKLNEVSAKVDALTKENSELKAKLDNEQKRPYVEKIVSAKILLGKITDATKQAEFDNLIKKDVEALKDIAGEYEIIQNAKKEVSETPQIRFKNANVLSDTKADDIVKNYQRLIA